MVYRPFFTFAMNPNIVDYWTLQFSTGIKIIKPANTKCGCELFIYLQIILILNFKHVRQLKTIYKSFTCKVVKTKSYQDVKTQNSFHLKTHLYFWRVLCGMFCCFSWSFALLIILALKDILSQALLHIFEVL